jgi:hypothetical protein
MRVVSVLPLLVVIPTLGCTGSPGTPTLPAFEVMTPTGIASVSIRESPPGIADVEFIHLVANGMESAMPGCQMKTGAVAPYHSRRIVWSVNPMAGRGVTRLFVNVSDGANSFAYEQQVLDNNATPVVLQSAVVSMTNELMVEIDRHDARAMAYVSNIASGMRDVVPRQS